MLVIVTLPEAEPLAAGANVASRVAVCPGFKSIPVGIPVALNPGPETLILEIVIVDWPELVRVRARALLLPTSTAPKFRVDALRFKPSPVRATACAVPRALVMPTHPEFATVSNKSKQKLQQHLFVIT